MKRVVVLFVLLLILCSCGSEKKIPSLESYPITLSGNLSYNGNSYAVTSVIHGTHSADITIDYPENLSGYSFKVDNSSVWVYYDSMQIELKNGIADIPFALIPEMLSVSYSDFESCRTEGDALIYYYKKDGSLIRINTKRNEDKPCRIEYTGEQGTVIFDIESFIA